MFLPQNGDKFSLFAICDNLKMLHSSFLQSGHSHSWWFVHSVNGVVRADSAFVIFSCESKIHSDSGMYIVETV